RSSGDAAFQLVERLRLELWDAAVNSFRRSRNKFTVTGTRSLLEAQFGGNGAGGAARFVELIGLEADCGDGGVAAAAVAFRDARQVVATQFLLPRIRAQRNLAAVRASSDRDRVERRGIGGVGDELVDVVHAE